MTSRSGMTLIELLVVICIIAMLMGMGVPTITSLLRGAELSQTVQILADQLALARQTAISTNRQIEVRLYKFIDPQVPAENTARMRTIQLFEVPESPPTSATATSGRDKLGYRALSKVTRLAGPSVIIDSGATLSSLIGNATGGTTIPTLSNGSDLGYSIPAVGTTYTAVRFSFMPDGSTNLPPQTQWFLTLHEAIKGDNPPTLPPNFATLQILPSNGKIRTYRP